MNRKFAAVLIGLGLVIIIYVVEIAKAYAEPMGFYEDSLIQHGAQDWSLEDHKCSNYHNNNDVLNELCHIGVGEATHAIAKEKGINEIGAHLAALLVLYSWESTNKYTDLKEVFTAPIKIHDNIKFSTNLKFTSWYFEYSKDMNIFE